MSIVGISSRLKRNLVGHGQDRVYRVISGLVRFVLELSHFKDYDQWQFMIRGELVNVSDSDQSSDGSPSNSCAEDENDQIYDSMGISGLQSFESRPSVPSLYDQ